MIYLGGDIKLELDYEDGRISPGRITSCFWGNPELTQNGDEVW